MNGPTSQYPPPSNPKQSSPAQPINKFSPPPQSSKGNSPAPPFHNQGQQSASSVQTDDGKCLAREAILPFRTKFYCFNDSTGVPGESFTICSNCFHSNVASHSLASNFVEYQPKIENMRFVCDFSFPRIRSMWYSQCIPQNSIQSLIDFPRFTETLSPCDGSHITSPGPFWVTKNQTVPELAICPTCYELFLRLTPFQGQFEKKTYPDIRTWSCDLALPFFRRALVGELESPNPSFEDLVTEYNTRFKIAPCAGVGNPITTLENEQSQSLVFTAVGGKSGNLCFACYCDYLANTSLEKEFVPAALTQEQKTTVTCDLASPYSKSAMEAANKQEDVEAWRNAVGVANKVGACFGRKGATEEEWEKKVAEHGDIAQWYRFNECSVIEICPSCYWLVVKLLKADSMFSPVTRPLQAGIVRMCYLAVSGTALDTPTESPDLFENSMTWRGRRLRTAISTGSEVGNFSLLLAEANSIAKEPLPCGGNERGFKRSSGRGWYGRISQNKASDDDCTIVICEECHMRTVKGTLLDSQFSVDLTDAAYRNEGDLGFVCQSYSNRARKELRDAAQRGDLASFARYWNTRELLRKKKEQWAPILAQQTLKMQVYNHQQSMNMMLKMNASANALMKIGGAGIVEAAMSDPGVRYGNSQVSYIFNFHLLNPCPIWFAKLEKIGYNSYTKGRAEAEQEFQDAQNMDIGTGAAMGTVAETQRLIAMATHDETAFKEYE